MVNNAADYSFGEELANSITHGIGAALGVAGLTLLVVYSALNGNAWHVVSTAIFGTTLVLLYAASTLYHSIHSPRVRRVLRILDHSSIYLLIAGTYTPFTLVTLNGPWGWSLFGVAWGLAVAGIAFKILFVGRFRIVSTLIYLGMGWMVVVAIRPLRDALPMGGMALLVAGGLSYTAGTVFYLWKRLLYHHAVWHLFVLGGSICHFFAVLFFVIPWP